MSDFDLIDVTTGQPTRVPAAEAEAGLREGRYRAGRPLRAVSPQGQAGSLAPDGIAQALARGYTLDTPEGEAARQHRAEHLVEAQVGDVALPAVTTAASTLRGASLGTSQIGEEALGIRSDIDRLREENPIAAGVGDIAGIALPALATGGTSAAAEGTAAAATQATARGILAPSTAVLSAGERAGSALTRTLLGGAEASAGRRIVARALGGAVEGAIQTGGQTVGEIATEAALGEDTGDIADRLISSTGLGAILGGGLHGAGALLGEGARGGARQARSMREILARQYAESTGRALPAGLDELMTDVVSHGAGVVRGESPALSRRFLGPDGREALRILERGDGALDDASRALSEDIDQMLPRSQHVGEDMLGPRKLASVRSGIGGDIVEQRGAAQQMLERVGRLQSEMEADFATGGGRSGSAYGSGAGSAHAQLRGQLRRAAADIETILREGGSDAEQGARLYRRMDELKQGVGRIRQEMSGRSGSTVGRDAFNQLYQDIRAPLENAGLWGEGPTTLQRESNQGWVNFIPWDRDVGRMLLREWDPIAGDFGRSMASDSARVRATVGRLGTESGRTDEQIITNWLDGMEQRNAAALAHHELSAEARANAEALAENIQRVRVRMQEARSVAETLAAGRALGQGNSGVAGLAAAVATGAGSLGLAAPLGAFAALQSPLRIAQTLAAVHRLAGQSEGAIRRAVTGFLASGRRAARVAVSGARAARATVTVSAYHQRLAELDRDRDPSQLATRIAASTRELARAAPRLHGVVAARAARAVSFLQGVRPRGTATGMFPGVRQHAPSHAEMDRFMRYANAVDRPESVVSDLQHGRATREAIEALRAVYPSLYQRLVREVTQQLASDEGEPPSYQHRLQLGLLLGAPVDPTMTPAFVSMLQSASTPQAPQQQRAAQGKAPDLSGQLASESDRLAGRLA